MKRKGVSTIWENTTKLEALILEVCWGKCCNIQKITKVDKINTNLFFTIHNAKTSRHLMNLEGDYFQGEKKNYSMC